MKHVEQPKVSCLYARCLQRKNSTTSDNVTLIAKSVQFIFFSSVHFICEVASKTPQLRTQTGRTRTLFYDIISQEVSQMFSYGMSCRISFLLITLPCSALRIERAPKTTTVDETNLKWTRLTLVGVWLIILLDMRHIWQFVTETVKNTLVELKTVENRLSNKSVSLHPSHLGYGSAWVYCDPFQVRFNLIQFLWARLATERNKVWFI